MAHTNDGTGVGEHNKRGSPAAEAQKPGTNGQDTPNGNGNKPGDSVTSNTDNVDQNKPISKDDEAKQAETTPTMQILIEEVRRCKLLELGTDEVADAFMTASKLPPITLASLTELEIDQICNNPKLRHDVNFDRELHFRPNLDGVRGQMKQKQIDNYWKALVGEIAMYGRVQKELMGATSAQKETYWSNIRAESEKRLPHVFAAIKDIIFSLVPTFDRAVVNDHLDPDFLMQELKNGSCDLPGLADWLAKMLKTHCAPMRDGMVDSMAAEITKGATEDGAVTLVNGIRSLLIVLECMKLDVANHQIRQMRAMLVDDTLYFARGYNYKRMRAYKIDVANARKFVNVEMDEMISNGQSPTQLEGLTSALLRNLMINIDYNLMFPTIFYLDSERLKGISNSLHMGLFQQACRDILFDVSLRHSPAAVERAAAMLKEKVVAITGATYDFLERIGSIAAEIMRLVLDMEGQTGRTDVGLMNDVERRLDVDLCNPNSVVYEHLTFKAFARILPKLQASVAKHIRFTTLQLHDTFVPPPRPPPPPPLGFGGFGARLVPAAPATLPVDEDEDVVRRLTHIIVLHWQVYGDLVYTGNVNNEGDFKSFYGGPSPSSSRSASPITPIAESSYDAGHPLSPTLLTVSDVPDRRASPSNSSAELEDEDAAPPRSGPSRSGPSRSGAPRSGASNHSNQDDEHTQRRTIDPEQ